MKFSIKRSKFITNKSTIIALASCFVAVAALLIFTYGFRARALSSTVISGLEGGRAPRESQFSVGNDVFLEISQKANANSGSLDAPENWTKIYFDSNKISTSIIGIYNGAFTGCEPDYNPTGCISGSTAVDYKFYASTPRGYMPDSVLAPTFIDDQPCDSPFTTINSSKLGAGWDAINLAPYIKGGCDGLDIVATPKTGRVVIYVQAVWRGGGIERTNAFKVGGAYQDGSSALAGYWSRYGRSIKRDSVDLATTDRDFFNNGQYAVQDRIGTTGSALSQQGNYSFGFGPDCYLGKDQPDPRARYLKWYDVDLSYYSGREQPYFELYDITNRNAEQLVTLTDGDGVTFTKVEGSRLGAPGGDSYKQMRFQGTGGHVYAWRWKNVIKTDGVVFWMPYDDFPFLNTGCGNYQQKIGLWSGRNSGGMSQNANQVARGGDTLNLLIDEGWSVPVQPAGQLPLIPGQAPFTTSDAFLSTRVGTYDGTFSGVPININEGGSRYNGNRDHIQWNLQGLGPKPTYTDRRWLMYSYQIKENAVDGSKHCFVATMNNETSKQPPLHTGNVATSNQICVTIDNSLKPYLTTAGGDVHAGNDCIVSVTNPRTPQTIIGPGVTGAGNGSSGSYVVSAGDRITQFGSGGTAGGTNLSLGKNGYYGSVCRPSLEMLQAELAKGGFESVPGDSATPFNLGSLAPGKRYLVYFAGSGTVYGKANASVTVYSNETVTIQGADFGSGAPVGGTTRANLPTVGVIAKNIKIKREVVGITAQLYATGNIDTCSDSAAVSCRSVLFLRGFAMAHDFSFKRSGTGSNGLQLAEILGYNAAFQLNPPPGFGTTSGIAKYLGERAPLN